MKNKNTAENLAIAIQVLKTKQEEEIFLLKAQFEKTRESLRPINLIKKSFSEITTSPNLGKNILSNAVGLATGYLSKKFLLGSTHNPIKKILGTVFEFGIANFVAKKANAYTNEESKTIENLKITK